MIIKSMSRKVPSFGQLIGYIDREGMPEQYRIRHHLFGRDPEGIRVEFERNAALLQKRRNGVYLYHEILSITRAQGLDPEEQKARLVEIVEQYIAARCPDNLVYGGLHQDKGHSLHFHLMISSNRADDVKRLRLSRAQFREIQVRLEEHVLKRYPELEQKLAMGKRSDRRMKQAEVELERRTGERPERQTVLQRVREALSGARDRDSLREALGRSDLELYIRGKNLGIIDLASGKKHRLNTLDPKLMPEFEACLLKAEVFREEEVQPNTGRGTSQENEPAYKKEFTQEPAAGTDRNETASHQAQHREPTMPPELQTPSPARKEQIERDEIEPDPLRDKMSLEDWSKRDTFGHKFAASWKRTIDDFRGRNRDGRDRDDDPERDR